LLQLRIFLSNNNNSVETTVFILSFILDDANLLFILNILNDKKKRNTYKGFDF
jgi:hypothetical protein